VRRLLICFLFFLYVLDKILYTDIIDSWAIIILLIIPALLVRKEVRQDEKAFERKGPFEGGRFLGWTKENIKR